MLEWEETVEYTVTSIKPELPKNEPERSIAIANIVEFCEARKFPKDDREYEVRGGPWEGNYTITYTTHFKETRTTEVKTVKN